MPLSRHRLSISALSGSSGAIIVARMTAASCLWVGWLAQSRLGGIGLKGRHVPGSLASLLGSQAQARSCKKSPQVHCLFGNESRVLAPLTFAAIVMRNG